MLSMSWKLFIKMTKAFINNQQKVTCINCYAYAQPCNGKKNEAINLKCNPTADWGTFSLPVPQYMVCPCCSLCYLYINKTAFWNNDFPSINTNEYGNTHPGQLICACWLMFPSRNYSLRNTVFWHLPTTPINNALP